MYRLEELAQSVLGQLAGWHLHASDFLPSEETVVQGDQAKLQLWNQTSVSAPAVQRFFAEVMREYGFSDWSIIPSADKEAFELSFERQILYLPTQRGLTVLDVAELLVEEIETHMFHSVTGQRSKLALLGSGTRGYLACEEGLAKFMVQRMWDVQGLGIKWQTWITSLALGLVQGVLTPQHSYETLSAFLYRVMLTGLLEKGKSTNAESIAKGMAFERSTRTFLGVPDFTVVGVCDGRDRVYLQGHLEVSELLKQHPLDRLLVGSISTSDLPDMEELHILTPALTHRNLGCRSDLFDWIKSLEH